MLWRNLWTGPVSDNNGDHHFEWKLPCQYHARFPNPPECKCPLVLLAWELLYLTLLWISFAISIISMPRTNSFGLVVIIYPGILNFSKMSFSPRADILQQLTKCLA